MSEYDIKMQRVEDAIIRECSIEFIEKFNTPYFILWMSIDAPCEMPHIYEKEFKNEFSQYMNSEDILFISHTGSNLVYHINTLIKVQPKISLTELIKYLETFIKEQLEDLQVI